MRFKYVIYWVCAALLHVLPTTVLGQSEGVPSHAFEIPGRHVLKGTLTRAKVSNGFSEHLASGLYRLTYLSETAPAILEVRVNGRAIGRSAPTQPFATILGGRSGEPLDLAPAGLCTSDVAPEEGRCAVEKLHFRLTQTETISIQVFGRPQSPGNFRILVDPLQESPEDSTLGIEGIRTAYLAFGDEARVDSPKSDYVVQLSKGQRIGVLLGSPDFTTAVEVRDSAGNLVASGTGLNEILDPCREARIDRLPKFDPLSQVDSYLTFRGGEDGVYTVRVTGQYRGETGLYVLRTFDVTDSRISVGQMRFGYVGGPNASEFVVDLPSAWQSEGSEITAYSALPVRIELTDEAGESLATSVDGPRGEFVGGLQTLQLSMLHWSSIDLNKVDVARLSKAKLNVTSKEPIPKQYFLIGLGTRWGSCGGGAVEPIAVLYPAVSDFQDQGYPMRAPTLSGTQLEATLYATARNSLRWYFLLQSPDGENKDPETLVSSYARYVPDHVPMSAWFVEFQLAIRVEFSPRSGATRLWTRVERRGYKEKMWHLDTVESAKAQQMLASGIQQAFREWTR
jgi:hypothetical protein